MKTKFVEFSEKKVRRTKIQIDNFFDGGNTRKEKVEWNTNKKYKSLLKKSRYYVRD